MSSAYLLDTNVLIWPLSESERLSPAARRTLDESSKPAFVSVVSIWEILLKHQTGKLWAGYDIGRLLDLIDRHSSWSVLGLEPRHFRAHVSIARFEDHKDPFDRLLIAQAGSEGLDIVTADPQFSRYGIPVVW